jgi:hypothetical protein
MQELRLARVRHEQVVASNQGLAGSGLFGEREFKLEVQRRLWVASPQRGEMFIAWPSFLYSEAP